jgi:hypothetical protein
VKLVRDQLPYNSIDFYFQFSYLYHVVSSAGVATLIVADGAACLRCGNSRVRRSSHGHHRNTKAEMERSSPMHDASFISVFSFPSLWLSCFHSQLRCHPVDFWYLECYLVKMGAVEASHVGSTAVSIKVPL